MLNLNDSYTQDERATLRVFLEDRDKEINFKKLPFEKKSDIFSKVFYRVVDTLEEKIIIPFDSVNNSTKLSSDSEGMYFNFFMSSLPRGRSYRFDFLIKEKNSDILIKDVASNFNVR